MGGRVTVRLPHPPHLPHDPLPHDDLPHLPHDPLPHLPHDPLPHDDLPHLPHDPLPHVTLTDTMTQAARIDALKERVLEKKSAKRKLWEVDHDQVGVEVEEELHRLVEEDIRRFQERWAPCPGCHHAAAPAFYCSQVITSDCVQVLPHPASVSPPGDIKLTHTSAKRRRTHPLASLTVLQDSKRTLGLSQSTADPSGNSLTPASHRVLQDSKRTSEVLQSTTNFSSNTTQPLTKIARQGNEDRSHSSVSEECFSAASGTRGLGARVCGEKGREESSRSNTQPLTKVTRHRSGATGAKDPPSATFGELKSIVFSGKDHSKSITHADSSETPASSSGWGESHEGINDVLTCRRPGESDIASTTSPTPSGELLSSAASTLSPSEDGTFSDLSPSDSATPKSSSGVSSAESTPAEEESQPLSSGQTSRAPPLGAKRHKDFKTRRPRPTETPRRHLRL